MKRRGRLGLSPAPPTSYTSEASMIVRLHHAQITIPRGAENECRRFYCDLLGLREVEKPQSLKGRGGFWLEIGDVQVHVGAEEGVERAATKAHLAYEVNDLKSWRAKLEERGIEILIGIPIPGYERFEFRDPFGNRVEFLQRT
jgi:catechol 2,3-dioxygenase-like lactoylglutathione lyase family enzyme